MAVHKFKRVQNDTGEPLYFTVKLDGAVKNLTSCTVNFIMKSPTNVLINAGHTACTVLSAAAGTCRYTFITGDLAEVGTYHCDLQLTDEDGKIITEFAEYQAVVRAENG